MKKLMKILRIGVITFAALVVLFFIAVILINVFRPEGRDTGVYQEKGGDVLYISMATGSNVGIGMGIVYNDDVLISVDKKNKFKPLKAGNAVIAVNYNYGPDYWYTDLYDITVDENLNINYEQRRVDYLLFYWNNFYSCDSITAEKSEDVVTVSENLLADVFENVYGVSNKCDKPDTTDTIKLSINYIDRSKVYYISEDRIVYLGVNYDNSPQWYEFIPDKCCSLDNLNELLENQIF